MIKTFTVLWTNEKGIAGNDLIYAYDAFSARNAFERCHPTYNVLSCYQS